MKVAYGSQKNDRMEGSQCEADELLVEKIASGDATAFEKLMARYLPKVVTASRRMLGDTSEAEDVAQEVFLRVWDHASRFNADKASFATWLYRIAGNLCIDRLRRQKTRGINEPVEAAIKLELPADQDRNLADKQLVDRVDLALKQLPERQRQAIVLFHFEGLRMKEASGVMEISVEALESLLARARRSLKKELAEEWIKFLPDVIEK